jgi:hypothetical protein
MHKTMAPPSKYRWGRGNWGQDLNLRPSGYEGDFTQPAGGRRPSCFQSSRVVRSSAKSTEVHAGIPKSPPVWTRSGQSFCEPLRTGDLRRLQGDHHVNNRVAPAMWASPSQRRKKPASLRSLGSVSPSRRSSGAGTLDCRHAAPCCDSLSAAVLEGHGR